MKTMRSNKLYSCVETSYTESDGDEVDAFNGTHKECLEWMRQRYNTVAGYGIDIEKDMAWIEDDCGLGHAVIQDGNGRFRYEWYVIIPWEKRGEEKKEWTVVFPYGDERERKFDDEKELVRWLKEGMYSCEGAERDHYVNMLAEYDAGKMVLHY